MKKYLSIENAFYFLLYAAIIIAGFYYIPATKYWLIDDSLSYLSIGKLYATGHWWKAVNSHWSPAFSWIISVFYFFNLDVLYSTKLIIIISIIFSVIVLKKITGIINLNPVISFCLCLTAAIVLFHPAIANFSPDVIYIPCLLFILKQILQEIDKPFSTNYLHTALIAGIGFYFKQYFIFFFLSVYSLFMIYQFAMEYYWSKKVLFRYLKTIFVFALIISPWILVLSIKENKFTISTVTSGLLNWLIL